MRIKSRVNPLKVLLLMLLIATILFIPNAFATKGGGETNIEGSDTGHASLTGIVGGWSDIKCGYRIYIVNESNITK